MRKIYTLIFTVFLLSHGGIAQPAFNPVEKGNKQAGLQIMLSPTDMFNSLTALNINEYAKTYGLHVAGSYGWFIERGWMIGFQSNIGVYHQEYGKDSQWGYEEDVFDLSIAPITRYYFTVGKKHRFKPFLFAGLPIVYNDVSFVYTGNQGVGNYIDKYLELRGTFGLGAAYFGEAGSIELNVSNMGFFVGVNKFIQSRKK